MSNISGKLVISRMSCEILFLVVTFFFILLLFLLFSVVVGFLVGVLLW